MTPAVVEMLKDVGVPVTVKAVDFGTLLQTVTKGTLPPNGGFTACRTSNNLDADDYVRDWATPTLVNWAPYPAELMALYTATRKEVDPRKRLGTAGGLAAPGTQLGAGGIAVPGGQGVRPQHARAALRPDPRTEHGLPRGRAAKVRGLDTRGAHVNLRAPLVTFPSTRSEAQATYLVRSGFTSIRSSI